MKCCCHTRLTIDLQVSGLAGSTTQPTVHLYSGEGIDVPAGRGGQHYRHRGGLCLETQHAPDSPHQPSFPSVVLRPEERYVEETVHLLG